MSTTVLHDHLDIADVDNDLAPLEFAKADAPQFVSAIVHAVEAAISSKSGISAYNGGVAEHRIVEADLGVLSGEGTTLQELVAIRDRAVAA